MTLADSNPPENSQPKPRNQVEWIVNMITQYRITKMKYNVHTRGLHYYIVTLPEDERMLPGKNGERLYQNTLQEYKKMCDNLGKARIRGLVPWDWVIDVKNDPVVEMPPRSEGDFEISSETPDMGSIPWFNFEKMDEFEKILDNIKIENTIVEPKFNNQTHRMVVAIEKATSKHALKRVCQRFGADLLVFSGQFSLTRVNEVIIKAMEEEKPIHIFYISDLDCAGWIMPSAFFRRLKEIYPHPDHAITRVALTREQVAINNLPVSFDPDMKKYPKKQVDNFISESGGRDCIELDALDEDVIVNYLEEALSESACLDEDEKESNEIQEKADKISEKIKQEFDIEEFEEEYDEIRGKFNEILKKIEDFHSELKEDIDLVESNRDDLESRIKEHLDTFIDDIIEEEKEEE